MIVERFRFTETFRVLLSHGKVKEPRENHENLKAKVEAISK